MKNNFGFYFHILFGVITFSLGVYFLKNIIFISLPFFIATIVNAFLLYREYDLQTRSTKNLDSQIVQEEILIKKSKSIYLTYLLTYFIFIILSVFSLYLLFKKQEDDKIIFTLLPIGVIIFSGIKLFLELKNLNSTVIKINRKGIQIFKKSFMNWNDIENERIISRTFSAKESRHESKSTVNYLNFYCKDEKFEIEIDNLDITDSELNNYLKIYRESFNESRQKII